MALIYFPLRQTKDKRNVIITWLAIYFAPVEFLAVVLCACVCVCLCLCFFVSLCLFMLCVEGISVGD